MPKSCVFNSLQALAMAPLPYSRHSKTDIGCNRADVDHQVSWMPQMLFSPRRRTPMGMFISHIQGFDLVGGDR